jgi:hypothetical protein
MRCRTFAFCLIGGLGLELAGSAFLALRFMPGAWLLLLGPSSVFFALVPRWTTQRFSELGLLVFGTVGVALLWAVILSTVVFLVGVVRRKLRPRSRDAEAATPHTVGD